MQRKSLILLVVLVVALGGLFAWLQREPARLAPPLHELNNPQTPFDGLLFAAD